MRCQVQHRPLSAQVIRNGKRAQVRIHNPAIPRLSMQTQLMHGRLSCAPAPRRACIERIDEDHANPRRLWNSMGEPEYLSPLQVEQLETASTLQKESQHWTYEKEKINLAVALPPQSVAAITIEFA